MPKLWRASSGKQYQTYASSICTVLLATWKGLWRPQQNHSQGRDQNRRDTDTAPAGSGAQFGRQERGQYNTIPKTLVKQAFRAQTVPLHSLVLIQSKCFINRL